MTILTRARKLAGPDRDFDAEIYRLAYDDGGWVGGNWYVERFMETVGSSRVIALPAYTASLDAIVGLIHATWGEGSAIDKYPAEMSLSSVGADPAAGPWRAAVWTGSDETDGRFQQGKTPAIALVCAFLAALNTQETTS